MPGGAPFYGTTVSEALLYVWTAILAADEAYQARRAPRNRTAPGNRWKLPLVVLSGRSFAAPPCQATGTLGEHLTSFWNKIDFAKYLSLLFAVFAHLLAGLLAHLHSPHALPTLVASRQALAVGGLVCCFRLFSMMSLNQSLGALLPYEEG